MNNKKLNHIATLSIGILLLLLGMIIGIKEGKDIVSTKLIEPYKIIYTKVEGKVVKTYYYKQQ